MRVIVTGGSGFIGTNLVDRLVKLNFEVLSLDIKLPQIQSHKSIYRNIDIRNLNKLHDVVANFDPHYFFHLAARTDLNGTTLAEYDSNILGVENICAVVAKCRNLKKVVFTSSMLVCKAGYIPKNINDTCPTTVYGQSKVLGEKIVINNKELIPEHVIVRPTSIWGPWFHEPYRNFFDIVLRGLFIHPGNKACTKTYGYVENSVNQLISLATQEQRLKDYYYIGDRIPLNISIWANQIAELAAIRKPLTFPITVYHFLAMFGDVLKKIGFNFPMSSFRLKNMITNNIVPCGDICEVNAFPEISVTDGILTTLEWLKNNKD